MTKVLNKLFHDFQVEANISVKISSNIKEPHLRLPGDGVYGATKIFADQVWNLMAQSQKVYSAM